MSVSATKLPETFRTQTTTSSDTKAKPFIKWVGGKSRLLPQLKALLPPGVDLMRHVEPFLGGGAFFFDRAPGRSLLSDINPSLINTYLAVRDHVDEVIAELEVLAAEHSKEAYYATRETYNTASSRPISRASTFIYLNKTCFNGLHRVNKKGHFNVPMGRYKKPSIVNETVLRAASQRLKGAELHCRGFESLLESARPGDFIYFDPPYAPVSDTANFTSYAQSGFNHEDQTRLRDVFSALHRRGCKLMLSNSDVTSIRQLYCDFQIDIVAAPRNINSNAKKRGKVNEVVVRNYR